MIPKRFKILAKKPDGTLINIGGRGMDSITKIQSAMEDAGYTDIKVERDTALETAFVKDIMDTNKCTMAEAIKTFKNMSRVMLTKGAQFIRKEEIVHA